MFGHKEASFPTYFTFHLVYPIWIIFTFECLLYHVALYCECFVTSLVCKLAFDSLFNTRVLQLKVSLQCQFLCKQLWTCVIRTFDLLLHVVAFHMVMMTLSSEKSLSAFITHIWCLILMIFIVMLHQLVMCMFF